MSVEGLIGVDVSSNNSSDWEDDDWDYGWVKATEGKSYVNPDAAHQLGVIRGRGKQAGHYHWLNDGSVEDQVQWFIDQADVQPGDLIACDWEDSSNPTCAQKDDWINQIQDHYGEANKVGLYCNRDWWFNRDTTSFAGDYLWIANPNGGSDPGIEYDWTFHQYTWEPYDKNRAPKFQTLADLQAWAGSTVPPEPPDPAADGVWYSTDYLFPQVKPNPTNPNGVKKGNEVKVTASGGLTARVLPGGPKSLDKDGNTIVRETGYKFDVTGDLVDGWVSGGTNWYSTDYLDWWRPHRPADAGLERPDRDPGRPHPGPGPVRVLRPGGGPGGGGQHRTASLAGACYVLAPGLQERRRHPVLPGPDADGRYADQWMQVNDAGHGQTFHAYRSAAGQPLRLVRGEPGLPVRLAARARTVSRTQRHQDGLQGLPPGRLP